MESQPALILAIDLAPRSTDLDQGIFDFAGKLIERFRWICPIHIVTFGPLSASVFARNVTKFPDEIKTLPRGTPDLRLVQDLFNEDLRLDEFHHVLFISCGTSEFSVPDSFFAPLFFIFTAPETQLNEEVAMRAWRHVMGRYIARGEEPNEKLMNHTRPCFVDLYNSLDDSLVATEIHLGCHNKLTIELGENLNFEVKCTPSICPYRSREKWLNVNEGILSVIGSVKMARLTNIASTNESIYAFRPSDEPKDADAYTVIAKSLAAEGFMLLCIYDEYYQALLRPVRSEHSDSWELSMQFIKSFATKENQWHLVSSKKKLPLRPTSYSVSSGLSYQCAATRNYWMNDNGLQSEIHRLTRSLKREDKVEALYQDINRIGLHALATSQHEFAPTILKILESRLPSSIVPTMHGHLKAIIDVLKKNGFEGWSKMKKK
ncbi:hypothetical protein L596_027701 [Steinernema carpocapsae]|uniref:Uncharacterized protein n=1 Tax=Steinernema carpocapsae TaxID=34508 RepID=A0A4U5LWA1_STECR|nr:hypothetical protein L596_027701 [Steinernema carpocapsae]